MSFLKHHGQMISQFQITPWKLNGNFTQFKFAEFSILSALYDIALKFSFQRIQIYLNFTESSFKHYCTKFVPYI